MKNLLHSIIIISIIGALIIGGVYYWRTRGLERQIKIFSINNESAQQRAVAYLVARGKKSIPYLVKALESSEPQVRINAVRALGRISDPGVIDPLVSVLVDSDPTIQYEAVDALESRGKESIPTLLIAAEAENPILRSKTIEIIGMIGDPSGIGVVAKALSDPYPEVRTKAVIALRRMAGEEAIHLIAPKLDDPSNNVRLMVVFALGDLKDIAAARRALEKALTNPDEQLREYAAQFLGDTGYADTEMALCRALHDKQLRVRWNAAEALGKVGGKHALQVLSDLLVKRREVDFVKGAAKKAMKKIRIRRKEENAP